MVVDDFAGKRILVVGDVMLDQFVRGEVGRVSPEAPALVLRIAEESYRLGGAGNVAVNIADLGATAVLVGLIGNDPAAHRLSAICALNPRLECQFIAHRDWPTITKTRFIAADNHLLRADHEKSEVPADVDERIIAAITEIAPSCDAMVISDYSKGLVTTGVIEAMVKAAQAAGVPLVADPKRRSFAAYRGCTVLTPNRKELAEATGLPARSEAEIAAAMPLALAAFGGPILLTRSEEGMSLFEPDAPPLHEGARCRAVRDVSGAGDTVAAALVLALGAGASLAEGMRIANAAAGVVVAKSGTASLSQRELADAMLVDPDGRTRAAKIATRTLAEMIRREWGNEGLSVGFTNGCFDIIHPGHVRLLRAARARCDRLIVGLNADASVTRLKGPARPIQTEGARADVIAALEAVDLVVLFDEDTPLELLAAVQPDVLFKGADYTIEEVVGGDLVRANGGRVELIDLVPGQSTTHLVLRSRELAAG